MRVLHLNHEKTWRGGERQTLLTAQAQRDLGVDSCIVCRRGSPLEEIAKTQGVPTISLPVTVPAGLPRLMQVVRACDVLHCHTGRAHSLGVLATLLRRKPLVVSRRVDFVPPASCFNRWKFSRADKVVCVSKWIARLLQEWGLPVEKIVQIYEAVPHDVYLSRAACRQQFCRKTRVSATGPIVGNVAALVGHKDHATLLRAARVVADRRRDVSFVVVGDGQLKPNLLRMREELDLMTTVHFTGFIPQAQRLLPGFDIFAMSSSMEGLGTIVLDAGRAGIPVVTTAAGGLPEAVLNEQTGLVVPVGDAHALGQALLRLLEDVSLAERLAGAAQRRVETEFSVANMARRHIELYQAVLGEDPTAKSQGWRTC